MPFMVLTAAATTDFSEDIRYLWRLLPSKQSMLEFGELLIYTVLQILLVWLFYRVAVRLMRQGMKRYLPAAKFETLYSIMRSVVKFLFAFIITAIFLNNLFNVSLASVLTLAGVGGIALGFGAQSLVKDIITGMFLMAEDQFRIGDIVEISGRAGTVEAVNLRTTSLRSANGDVHIIPNGEITLVTNMCKDYKRAVVELNVAYTEDIDVVVAALQAEMNELSAPELTDNTPEVIGIIRFDASAVVLRINCDCKPGQNWALEREIRRLAKKRMDAEGFAIGVPVVKLQAGQRDESR